MLLCEFVKSDQFMVLFQGSILDEGGDDCGEYNGNPFVIVTSWNSMERLEQMVKYEIGNWHGEDEEGTSITFDNIMAEYCADGEGFGSDYWGFDDEYARTSCCGKIVKTSPDSYGWQPDWVRDEEYGEITCKECLCKDPDWFIDQIINNYRNANNGVLPDSVLEEKGFEKVNKESFENGWHEGMNDSPEKELQRLNKLGYDVIFNISETSQFYIRFDAWVKEREYDCDECGDVVTHTNWCYEHKMCQDCANDSVYGGL